MTGLPNRNLFFDRLDQAIKRAQRQHERLAVLFLDLDDFKPLNDRFGHSAGDQVLQTVAKRLVASLRQGDTVCRHGGDEFILLLAEIREANDAEQVAAKVLVNVSEPMRAEWAEVRVTGSIGIAVYPEDGANAELLLKHADLAMYEGKGNNKNTYRRYRALSSGGDPVLPTDVGLM